LHPFIESVQAKYEEEIESGHLTILDDMYIQSSPIKIPELTGTRLVEFVIYLNIPVTRFYLKY